MSIDAAIALITETEAYEVVGADAEASLVRTLVNSVSAHFQSMIDRSLIRKTYTDELYDGSGTDELVLANRPVASVASLYIGVGATTPMVAGVDKDYVVDLDAGIIVLMAGVFERGRRNVKVTYDAGYTVATVPYDIKWAVKKAISFLYNERSRIGISATSTPDQVTTYIEQAYPRQVTEIIAHYRRAQVIA